MLRLYVLRHAKSSWAEPGKSDFERGLNERGEGDLPRIAAAMREKGYLPDRIFCSPSLRTRLTLHGIMAAFGTPPRVDYVDSLYEGGVDAYFECIRRETDRIPLMIIGHNPMCEAFSTAVLHSGDAAAVSAISVKFPTGALAVFDIDRGDWSELAHRSGYLVDFIMPRDI